MDAFAEAWGQTVTAHWFDRGSERLPQSRVGASRKNAIPNRAISSAQNPVELYAHLQKFREVEPPPRLFVEGLAF